MDKHELSTLKTLMENPLEYKIYNPRFSYVDECNIYIDLVKIDDCMKAMKSRVPFAKVFVTKKAL
jgi:hypothetical protein